MPPTVITLPDTGDLGALADDRLMQLARDLAAHRRTVDAASAAVAGELARRSDRSLGYAGLAQSQGDRTAEKLVSRLTGVSVGEARSMVTVGVMEQSGWMDPITAGVTAGDVGIATAAAIRAGLGEPNADIDSESLRAAAERLAVDVAGASPSDAGKAARQLRDELDAIGVSDREAALRESRYLRVWKQGDGGVRVDALLDPEGGALLIDALDRVTMPRRQGPRFLDPAEKAREEAATTDTRTIEQVMADALVQFVVMAAGVDDGTVFGTKSPAVRMHVDQNDYRTGIGAGYLEGNPAGFSMPTVQRFACAAGIVPILFDDTGQPINVGRQFRTYTPRQRIAIAARDGGCIIRTCDRPPSWTEVHHCTPWTDNGPTDIDNGISLCRHHHMWLHNTNRWITHNNGQFWLHTPGSSSPELLVTKHPLRQRSHHLTG